MQFDFRNSIYYRSNQRALRGWDLEAKKLFPTLNRKSLEEGWGFSLIGGVDYLEAAGQFSGIVTRKGESGLWLKVRKSTNAFNFCAESQLLCSFSKQTCFKVLLS